MRIALVCSDRGPCPPVKGGAIQLLISRVAPLLAKNHEVTVFSITDSELPDKETVEDVNYVRYDQKEFLEHVCKDVKAGGFDIIQLYNRPGWITAFRDAAPEAAIILSLHNLIKEDEVKPSRLNHADQIITVSRFVAKDTEKRFSKIKGRTRPVYTGVDLNEYAPKWSKEGKQWRKEIRKKYGIGSKDPVLLFVGRLVPYKGCHHLIRAMKRITKKHKKAKLLVVGSRWYADDRVDSYLKKLYRFAKRVQKSGKPVIFTSYVSVDEIPKYFAAADLFMCSSQWKEPLARVHYEAMAAGLPIITTKRGGNHEVIKKGKNGLLIKNYKNHKAFAKSALKLLGNPKLSKSMGRVNRRLAEKVYNFDRVAEELEEIYQSLVDK
jgi:spore coat protein SA